MKKTIAILSIIVILLVGVIIPNEKIESLKSYLANAATITGMTVTRQYNYVAGTAADPSQVNYNENALYTQANTLLTDINTLNTYKAELSSSGNTFTNVQTFQNTCTFSSSGGLTFGSGGYYLDQTFVLDGDNAGAGATQSVRFNRGSTDANDARFEWDETNDIFTFTSDGTTLVDVKTGDGDTTGEVLTYDQAGKLTTTNTWTLVNTFNELPTLDSYEAPTANAQFAPKKYIDDQTASLSVGGIIQQSSTPAVTANTLWIDTTSVANLKFLRANGSVYAPITGIHQGTSAPSSPTPLTGHLWIDTTSTSQPSFKRYDGSAWKQVLPATIDAATTFTGAVTHTAIPSCAVAPTTANHLTNKTYVDSLTPKIFSATAQLGTITDTTPTSLFAAGAGSKTLSANTLQAGSVVDIVIKGTLNTGGTPGTATAVIKLGSTTIDTLSFTTPTAGLTGVPFELTYSLVCYTAGASGTVRAPGFLKYLDTAATPDDWNGSAVCDGSTVVVDTTASQAIDVVWTYSSPSGDAISVKTANIFLYK